MIIRYDFIPNRPPVLVCNDPRQRFGNLCAGDGIGNVKQIPQPGRIGVSVKYRDTVCAALDPATRIIIPVGYVGHGCGGGALLVNQKLVWETIIISNGRCPQKCFPAVAALRDGLQLLFGKRTDIFIFCHRLLLIARAVLLLTVWHFQVPATSYLPAYTQSAEHKKRVSRYLCVSQ